MAYVLCYRIIHGCGGAADRDDGQARRDPEEVQDNELEHLGKPGKNRVVVVTKVFDKRLFHTLIDSAAISKLFRGVCLKAQERRSGCAIQPAIIAQISGHEVQQGRDNAPAGSALFSSLNPMTGRTCQTRAKARRQ